MIKRHEIWKENVFFHPISVVEQRNYHVIVGMECSRVHHSIMSMLFINNRVSPIMSIMEFTLL